MSLVTLSEAKGACLSAGVRRFCPSAAAATGPISPQGSTMWMND
jgi:hypothetical protein